MTAIRLFAINNLIQELHGKMYSSETIEVIEDLTNMVLADCFSFYDAVVNICEQYGINENDPNTPQWQVRDIWHKLHDAKHNLSIAKREEYENKNDVSVYGSDDYCWCSAWDTHFYFGYEVTKCPIKSHKDEDDCYEKDCEKREWVFQVTKNDKVVFEMLDSELSYPEATDIYRQLILGMSHYIKTLDK